MDAIETSQWMPKEVALVRGVPGSCLNWKAGPWVGMAALQLALRELQPSWLSIETRPRERQPRYPDTALPWFWCWMDSPDMHQHAASGRPFLAGPNMYPSAYLGQPNCVGIFVHSSHHLAWLEQGSKASLRHKTKFWPYPIAPIPQAPLTADIDILFYCKKPPAQWPLDDVFSALQKRWPRITLCYYGGHSRSELFDLARRARCCVYWSGWDTGSLVQAEVMLCGCPCIGIKLGSPWIIDKVNGVLVNDFDANAIIAHAEEAMSIDRDSVRRWALGQFSQASVAKEVLSHLSTALYEYSPP